MTVIAHWTTQKVRLGSLAATQAVVSHEGGVIAWCEGLEDAEQVVAALNNSRGAVWALNEALGYLRLHDDRQSAIDVIEHGLRSAGVDPSKPLGGQ